jgi:hypoxanthine phosphoribosyltransferase
MLRDDFEKILITEDQIVKRCTQIGEQLTAEYQGREAKILFVALLKGSVPFMAELIKHIDLKIHLDFMAVSSYNGTESEGDIKILKDLDASVVGKDIILVEDIVDTGKTIQEVKRMMYNKGAHAVKVVTLLDKPSRRVVEEKADYVGFEVPDEFVVGFGLDYNQDYRNLPYVGVLKKELYAK